MGLIRLQDNKGRMGVRMFEAARRMTLASLPADLPEGERKRLLFERFYGEPLPIS